MPVYAIATINIHDRTEYAKYEAGFMPILNQYDGKVLSVDESPVLLEGQWPFTRTVLLEFTDADELQRWYRSDAYQALMKHRLSASDGHVVIINGLTP